MDAFFARNRLSSYLDGTLEEAEAADLATAIERDPELRRDYEAMRRAVELLRREGPTKAPAGFHARVMSTVEAEPLPGGALHWLRRSFARVPVEAMALAAAALVVVVVIQGRPGEPPTTIPLPSVAEANKDASPGELAKATPPMVEAQQQGVALPPADTAGAVASARAANEGDLPPGRKSARPSSAKSGSGSASGTKSLPGAVYVPEWDQPQEDETTDGTVVAGASDPKDLVKPLGYRISVSHARVLYDLSALAEQMGGRMTDGAGRTVSPRALMMEDNAVQLYLVVPADQATEVGARLRKMGAAQITPPANAPLYQATQAGFAVEVNYNP